MPGFKTLTGMTGTGSAVELAEMLRQLGRGRDTVLAHITPEEAQMLMDQGGSGTINPNTGLPEFLDIYGGDFGAERSYDVEAQPEGFYGGREPTMEEFQRAQPPMDMTGFRQPTAFEQAMAPQEMPPGMRFDYNLPPATEFGGITGPFERPPLGPFPREALPPQPEQPGLARRAEQGLEKIQDILSRYPRVAGALGASAQGIAGLVSARRQREAAQRQAGQLREMGRPLREQAESLRQQALSGVLTPQQAREQEVARARMRQAGAQRGVTTGTQSQMIENQLQRARAELSQTNLENAFRQLNLANRYEEAALLGALQADTDYNRDLQDLAGMIGNMVMQSSANQQQQGQRPQQPRAQQQSPQQQLANRQLITQEPSERLRRG